MNEPLAYYNENEPFAATWLQRLADAGQVAPGRVDRRSIEDVRADDVRGFGQRHFFGGIGGWSLALRLAGVPDSADIWTGSCPCQPLSDAGKRLGTRDARHLWPTWFRLIEECKPPIIFGEQVASRLGLEWLDLVRSDLERCGYAFGASDLCAAGVGAPHRRQRLFFVAHTDQARRSLFWLAQLRLQLDAPHRHDPDRRGETGSVGDSGSSGSGWHPGAVPSAQGEAAEQGEVDRRGADELESASSVGDADSTRWQGRSPRSGEPSGPVRGCAGPSDPRAVGSALADPQEERRRSGRLDGPHGRAQVESERLGAPSIVANAVRGAGGLGVRSGRSDDADQHGEPQGPLGQRDAPQGAPGFWRDCEWLPCEDGVSRPVEPGTFPLAHGVPGRVGLLRGYGNAIVHQVAAVFVKAALQAIWGEETEGW